MDIKNLEKKVKELANGNRSASKIFKLINRDLPKDQQVNFDDVKKIINLNNLHCPQRQKPKYSFQYRQKQYDLVYLVPGESALRPEIITKLTGACASEVFWNWALQTYNQSPDNLYLKLLPKQLPILPGVEKAITKERIELLPANQQYALGKLCSGVGLVTNFEEQPELIEVRRNNIKIDLQTWKNQWLIDEAEWNYPDENSILLEFSSIWRAIRKKRGDHFVYMLLQELNDRSPAKIWVTEKNFT